MKRQLLNEVTDIVYRRLVERFGEPIGRAPARPGVPDERSQSTDVCAACGEDCDVCLCEINEIADSLDEVTPPGFEKVVRGLKKSKQVDNPWAVAWAMKKKGIKPKK